MNLKQRYKSILGEGYKGFLACSGKRLPSSIRINTLKIEESNLVRRLRDKGVKLDKVPFALHGYYTQSDFSLGSTPEYLLGFYYMQEAASQIPAEVLSPSMNDLVLDMAASPGGKTTQLAQIMGNKGEIIAVDLKKRCEPLVNNIERMGVSNASVYEMDAREVGKLNTQFDKILLDAPCSGNILQHKDWLDKRKVKDFENRSELQKELVHAAFSVLKKNGVLVYSTCSLEPEENEFVVQYAIELGMKVEPINLNIGSPGLTDVFGRQLDGSIKNCVRFWPHLTNTQGFFVAKLRKV